MASLTFEAPDWDDIDSIHKVPELEFIDYNQSTTAWINSEEEVDKNEWRNFADFIRALNFSASLPSASLSEAIREVLKLLYDVEGTIYDSLVYEAPGMPRQGKKNKNKKSHLRLGYFVSRLEDSNFMSMIEITEYRSDLATLFALSFTDRPEESDGKAVIHPYGLHNELRFLAWIYSLVRIGFWNETDYYQIVTRVTALYRNVVKKLIRFYQLKVAELDGDAMTPILSYGVFGAAQLIHQEHKFLVTDMMDAVKVSFHAFENDLFQYCYELIHGRSENYTSFMRSLSEKENWAEVNRELLKYYYQLATRFAVIKKIPSTFFLKLKLG